MRSRTEATMLGVEDKAVKPCWSLIVASAGRDGEAFERLLDEYAGLLRRLSRHFFLPGAEQEDLLQEARVGLWEAWQSFDPSFGRPLAEHLAVNVRNKMIQAVRRATRKKHGLLSQAHSLDLLPHEPEAPEVVEDIVLHESLSRLSTLLRQSLSELERSLLRARLEGISIAEVARHRGVSSKQAENALFRARQKARHALRQLSEAV